MGPARAGLADSANRCTSIAPLATATSRGSQREPSIWRAIPKITSFRQTDAFMSQRRDPSRDGVSSAWIVRVVVIGAFLGCVAIYGPRAWRVVQARWPSQFAAAAERGPSVALDRLAARSLPSWARGELLIALLADLEPRLRGEAGLMDDAALATVQERIRASAWVSAARLERLFPDRLQLRLELRRPVAKLVVEDGPRRGTVAFDAEGRALPVRLGDLGSLPQVVVSPSPIPFDPTTLRAGAIATDRRILAACAVAEEWLTQVAADAADLPRLVAIDARNVDYEYVADPRHSRVLVGLARRDDAVAWFQHGLARRHGGAVDVETRRKILDRILARHPGLLGVDSGDLRLLNLWEQYLVTSGG
jgi:hypothetical protein